MKVATCFIETRNLPNLKEIIWDNHLNRLPKEWNLIVFHGVENKLTIREVTLPIGIGGTVNNSRIAGCQYYELPEHLDQRKYNELLTSVEFWEKLQGYDRVLIFQHDSKILRDWTEKDNAFLEFNYIGSPWKFQEHGGNGGLSFRNPKVMKSIIEKKAYKFPEDGNEDIYFSNEMFWDESNSKGLAPRLICRLFACESIFELGTLGYHAIDKYLTPEQCKEIETQYEYREKIELSEEENQWMNASLGKPIKPEPNDSMMGFHIGMSQHKKLKEWQEAIKQVFGEYGFYKYIFTPDGIGCGVEVYSELAKRTLDLTEVENY